MLDWKRVVNDPQTFKAALSNRGMTSSEAARILSEIERVSKDRIALQIKCDSLKAERNKLSLEVGSLMKSGQKDKAQQHITTGKLIGAEIEKLETVLDDAQNAFKDILENVPNIPHSTVPVGTQAKDNTVVRQWGERPKFSFQPKSHDELGEQSGGIDFERAARICGSRFTFLRGPYAQLERALASFMLDLHRGKGYEEIVPPYMVGPKALYGTGQFPKFKEDVFSVNGGSHYLIPTAEVPVTNLFADEILDEERLPYRFVSFSPCFRSEAGSYGKDTKGLIRQHQFHKVELVKLAHPDNSLEELEAMVKNAEEVLQKLEIAYRTMQLCTGDMGFSSQKTYDIEVWLPGSVFESDQRGCYREISSCSDCGDFQARRAGIRFKTKGGKGTRYVHTLNGSGLAVGRTLIAVVENYQNEDGSVRVPKVLQPYMNGMTLIPAKL